MRKLNQALCGNTGKLMVNSIMQKITVQSIVYLYPILTSISLRKKGKAGKHKYIFLLVVNITKQFKLKVKMRLERVPIIFI